MARILFPSDESWYDEMKVISSYYETELENMILSHVETVFPNYITIKFKKDIYTSSGGQGRAPDLALVNKDYSDWWIIEVELDKHTIDHVKSQIEVFVNGEYNSFEIAKYIKSQDHTKTLDLAKLQSMVGRIQPKVLIIVDEHDAEWKIELEKLNALICIFQVFKSKHGLQAYRLNGDYPFTFNENKSHCRYIKSPPNMLEVINPDWLIQLLQKANEKKKKASFFSKEYWSSLGKSNSSIHSTSLKDVELEIDFLSKLSKWKVIHTEKGFYLKAIGINKVPIINSYLLYADASSKLYFKIN